MDVGLQGKRQNVNAVTHWNRIATEVFPIEPGPIVDSRDFAILHAAIHDAVNGIERLRAVGSRQARGGARWCRSDDLRRHGNPNANPLRQHGHVPACLHGGWTDAGGRRALRRTSGQGRGSRRSQTVPQRRKRQASCVVPSGVRSALKHDGTVARSSSRLNPHRGCFEQTKSLQSEIGFVCTESSNIHSSSLPISEAPRWSRYALRLHCASE